MAALYSSWSGHGLPAESSDPVSCAAESSAIELISYCSRSRAMAIPFGVLALLYATATAGALCDVIKGILTFANVRTKQQLARHWANQDSALTQNPLNHEEAVDMLATFAYDPYFEQRHLDKRTKLHGQVGSAGVVLEDVLQLACTLYVELFVKSGVLTGSTSGEFSAIAVVSVACGLLNATFKAVEGIQRARTGILDEIGAGSTVSPLSLSLSSSIHSIDLRLVNMIVLRAGNHAQTPPTARKMEDNRSICST